jgi:hypothetical protein
MRTALATGAGIINRESPLDLLKLQVATADRIAETQQENVTKLKRDYDIALSQADWTPQALADCRSQLVIATDKLAICRSNATAKKNLLDIELGRAAQQDELHRLEQTFQDATTRLDKSRVTIEKLKEAARVLPDRQNEALREFNQALQSWNVARTDRDAAKSRKTPQRASS